MGIVRRTPARASASPTDHLLFYRIAQGGSWFRNERGEQFLTRAGSVVVGSQASAYTAAAAAGRDWRFSTIRIASGSLPVSGERIRRGGFRLLPEGAAISNLAAHYLQSFSDALPQLSPAEVDAAVGAFDLLVAASLGDTPALEQDGGRAINAARLVAARSFIEHRVENPRLSPEHVAAHLGVSARQLHRGVPIGGNPHRLCWYTSYDSLGDMEKFQARTLADAKYLSILGKAANIFIAGSAHDDIWRSL